MNLPGNSSSEVRLFRSKSEGVLSLPRVTVPPLTWLYVPADLLASAPAQQPQPPEKWDGHAAERVAAAIEDR